MELITPGTGLIIWQTFVFLILLFFLGKFAWKPILNALNEREATIQKALDSAEEARAEMAKLQSENEKLLDEARKERDLILKEAREIASQMRDEAREDAAKQASRMVEQAREAIVNEKRAALIEVKNQVAEFSLIIAEQILKNQLSKDKEQKAYINEMIKDLKLN